MPDIKLDNKYLSAGLAGVGIIALALAGFVTITTPAEQECQSELTEVKVKLAGAEARLELLEEAKDACKSALEIITRSGDSQ